MSRIAQRKLRLLLLCTLTAGCGQGSTTTPEAETGQSAPGGEATSTNEPRPGDRRHLPLRMPDPPTFTELDVRDVPMPAPPHVVAAPDGAPNVVVLLIDDIGFGMASAFAGEAETPALAQLADEGVRFTGFHTTALCSPTRVALQTGRNHHAANAGSIMEMATAFPGNAAVRPDTIATLPEILLLNGYATAAFGKYHETPPWETSVAGPRTRWPTRSGYERFYGFIGGETNQWHPAIYDNENLVDPSQGVDGYHFTTDMTDQAINWMRSQRTLRPERPFFMYYAPGAVHAPHHVPREYIEKYRGRFDSGWDAYRERVLARQIERGVVPAGTELADKPDDIQDWDSLPADARRVFARQMEVYAAFVEHTDAEVGRLIDAIDELDLADETLVIAIIGDNGSSAEGGMVGLFNEMQYFNGIQPTVEDLLPRLDDFGGPDSYGHMAAGWAVAGATPFAWTKQVASDFGGTRNPVIVRWPDQVPADGSVRAQFSHVVDVAPTVLEAAGLPMPETVHGVRQRPMDGVSMLYAAKDAGAPTRHTTQYFEMFGNRAVYHDGWFARVIHLYPWGAAAVRPLAEDVWELYDTRNDYSLRNDLAQDRPEKLAELQALFQREAVRNHVLPIDDRRLERLDAEAVGRPDLVHGRTEQRLFPGLHLAENTFISIKNRSFSVTVDLASADARPNGVLLAQAGQFGGWAVWLDRGVPTFTYNFLGTDVYRVRARRPLRRGELRLVFDFAYDGGGPGKGGTVTIRAGDEAIGEGRVEQTQVAVFSADETVDVGEDLGTPVDARYGFPPANELRGAELSSVAVETR